ncbi:MAG: zinc-ribbon domain-containing protein [Thermoplasmata archaeon]
MNNENEEILCPKCGSKNKSGAKFCTTCGSPLDKKPLEGGTKRKISKASKIVLTMLLLGIALLVIGLAVVSKVSGYLQGVGIFLLVSSFFAYEIMVAVEHHRVIRFRDLAIAAGRKANMEYELRKVSRKSAQVKVSEIKFMANDEEFNTYVVCYDDVINKVRNPKKYSKSILHTHPLDLVRGFNGKNLLILYDSDGNGFLVIPAVNIPGIYRKVWFHTISGLPLKRAWNEMKGIQEAESEESVQENKLPSDFTGNQVTANSVSNSTSNELAESRRKLNLIFNSLESLRSAMFWLFLGTVFLLIPVLDIVGSIMFLIGFILLIGAMGKMGRTTIQSAGSMRGTGRWAVVYLVASILGLASGAGIFYMTVIRLPPLTLSTGSMLSLLYSFLSLSPLSIFFVAVEAVAIISWIGTFIKLGGSLKALGREFNVKRLIDAGRLITASIIINAIGAFFLVLNVLSFLGFEQSIAALMSNQSFLYPFSILGYLIIPSLILLVGTILEIIAFHGGYSGTDEVMGVL